MEGERERERERIKEIPISSMCVRVMTTIQSCNVRKVMLYLYTHAYNNCGAWYSYTHLNQLRVFSLVHERGRV